MAVPDMRPRLNVAWPGMRAVWSSSAYVAESDFTVMPSLVVSVTPPVKSALPISLSGGRVTSASSE